MIQVIRVSFLDENSDMLGLHLKKAAGSAVSKIRTNRAYYLEGINAKEARVLAEKLFCEKLNQQYTINTPLVKSSSRSIEIAYKPGVMNPESASIIKAAADLGIKLVAADSATEYHFWGKISSEKFDVLINQLSLFNKTVEYIVDIRPKTLLLEGKVGPTNIVSLIDVSDEDLMSLSKDKLFLNLEEMKVIQKYFIKLKRNPTDCELETLAQTWSEHCAHKTFKAKLIVDGVIKEPLIKRLQKESAKHGKLTVSSYVDNSGVMEFYNGMSICGKVETHNSPSAIEPYGGAATGSGGVFRDILGTGLGAQTIASTDIFCFAPYDLPKKDLPAGCLPPDYLLKRIVKGVQDYGNRMGIPTNNGSVHFHPDFRAKPTVIVGAYGLIPTKKAQKGSVKVGDVIVAVGGKTGRDGVHGATFSSAEMTNQTVSTHSSAVQIGNAIEEKRMFDAIIEARDQNLIRAIQDCGAGGFSSAVGEIAEETGVRVDLEKAPLKYQGLSPWEIWVSESQERMVLAIAPKNLKSFLRICKKYNVEAVPLGMLDGSKSLKIYFKKKLICDLDMEFLHHGLPQRVMKAVKPIRKKNKDRILKTPKTREEWIYALSKVLTHGNVNSKEPIVRLYDHTVQGSNAMQPFTGITLEGPTDAAVMRPDLDKSHGMVISHGLNPVLNSIDPYWGSIWAGIEAMSNYVAVGGNIKEASLINNYIWPFPDEMSLWSLDRSVDAVVELMKVFKTPVISGKDSLSSTYRNKDVVIKIPPVLCISVFGRIPDVSKTASSDFKKVGSSVYLVGSLDSNSLAGSIYCETQGILGFEIPKPNLKIIPKVFEAVYTGIQKKLILASHDVSEGGLITGIFEMSVGGGIGVDLKIPKTEKADHFLFNETAGAFLVEVEDDNVAVDMFKDIPHQKIGNTISNRSLIIWQNGKMLFEEDTQTLKKAWQKPMKELFS